MTDKGQGRAQETEGSFGSEELLARLRRLSWAQFGLFVALGRATGMGPNDVWALERLNMEGPLGPAELGRRLGGMRSASSTALVDRLEAAGHVERQRDPSDRRRLAVVPTQQAFGGGQDAIAPLVKSLGEVAEEFTEGERAVIARYLERVTEATDNFNEGHAPR